MERNFNIGQRPYIREIFQPIRQNLQYEKILGKILRKNENISEFVKVLAYNR